MHVLYQIALVALGSALGGLLRWGVSMSFARWLGTALPWGTLFINLTGSLFLGWFMTIVTERLHSSQGAWLKASDLHLMLAVGFTGAYTTFSTFEYENHALLAEGRAFAAAAYAAVSLFAGLLAVRWGVHLARG